jgi:glutamate/tyrosine decarboxylase-like PLP-dependent enzyme
MAARRSVRDAKKEADREAEGAAYKAVDEVMRELGERGPAWWDDGSPDLNRHMAMNTPYADWYAKLARFRHGGL